MNSRILTNLGSFLLLLILFPLGRTRHTEEPVVYTLLFYSPSCPHRYKVITDELPPLIDKFGDQIQILAINTYTEQGNELFITTVNNFNIPPEHQGVPMFIV